MQHKELVRTVQTEVCRILCNGSGKHDHVSQNGDQTDTTSKLSDINCEPIGVVGGDKQRISQRDHDYRAQVLASDTHLRSLTEW